VKKAHGGFPCVGVKHVADELVALQESGKSLQAGNLEVECSGFEAVWTRRVGGHGIGDDIATVHISACVRSA
jgi:hypothetical protein